MPKRRKRANGTGSISHKKGRARPRYARLPAGYTINGKEVRQDIGFFKTYKEAEEALNKYMGLTDIKTFADVYEYYKTTNEYTKISKNSQQRYENAFKEYKPIHNKNMIDIRYTQLQKVLDDMVIRGYDKKVNGVMTHQEYSKDHLEKVKLVATKVYKIALQDGLVTENIASLIQVGGVKQKNKKQIFTKEEITKLRESIPYNPHARHILVMCFTGMRTTEYRNLTRDSINFETNTITNFGIKTDEGKSRTMFIHPQIKNMLMDLCIESKSGVLAEVDGKATTYDKKFYDKIYYLALKKAGVKRKTPYTCRYTFATIAYQSGVSEVAIQRLMGHTDFKITEQSYIQDLSDFVYEELQKFNVSS